MLFNSIPFLFLFIITYLIYWNSNGKIKKSVILISSIIFYAYHSIPLLFHFLLIILVNYLLSNLLFSRKNQNKSTDGWIKLIVVFNLVNLGFFKYFYFFSNIFFVTTGLQAIKDFTSSVYIILPLAISFYTFQLIALQIDIHRDKITKQVSMMDYFIFILFFPQLIAGPIMRSEEFLPKIDFPEIDFPTLKKGLYLIITGLIKKVVIADNLGVMIHPVYSSIEQFNSITLFIVNFAFITQVYCDFGGYSDIARGLAYLLGYEIPINFRGPFLSTSFSEFWTRWHITLSTWLRDYLYISLGGNRKGFTFSVLFTIITMSLGGLWHGADIAYLLWGLYFGLLISLERLLDKFNISIFKKDSFKGLKLLWIVLLISFSGIFFRSGMYGEKSLEIISTYFIHMFSFKTGVLYNRWEEMVLYIFIGFFFNFIEYKERTFLIHLRKYDQVLLPLYSILLLFLLGLYGDGGGDFIYFQF
jgi:alginate O-acetyltransferase complex protein AlgI